MIIIDKLCYRSKLRYVSAAEKLLYAVSSLMICVLTRSYAAALIVFIANGILTVGKGKIPLSCYVRLLMIPIVFLIVGTGAVFLNLSKVPMDAFAVPVGFCDGSSPVDAVIATGSDNANRYFRTQYAGIPALLRGSRQSVAVLSGRETEAQLEGLADDIWAYSGLGCRSVSLLFVPEGYDLRLRMPAVNEKYRNNYRQQKALLTMTGRPFRDLGSAVAVEERAFPAALSRIACSRYKTLGEVEAWLAQHDAELQCVVSECVSHGRRTGFGRAQFPALTDYPDDRDVIAFLAALN